MVSVNDADGLSAWAVNSRSRHAFFCPWSSEYWCDAEFTRATADAEMICLEANEEVLGDEYYYWECDGEWHSDRERTTAIPDYHCSSKPWKYNTIPHSALGVELECWSSDREETYELAQHLGLEGEEDSSLCSEHGIEIIGAPMLLSEYHAKANRWRRFCDEATDVKCWFGRNGSYGQHISANTRDVGQLTLSRAICFIHDNEEFVTQLAGREGCSYGRYKKGLKCSTARREATDMHNATQYCEQRSRLEFRIFRANRRWDGFIKNVEFVHAVMAFAKENPIESCKPDPFVQWVSYQTGRWNSYPALLAWFNNRNL
jgi:hypothetical protein